MKIAVVALVALLGLTVAYTSAEEDVNAVVTRKLKEFFFFIFGYCLHMLSAFKPSSMPPVFCL